MDVKQHREDYFTYGEDLSDSMDVKQHREDYFTITDSMDVKQPREDCVSYKEDLHLWRGPTRQYESEVAQ